MICCKKKNMNRLKIGGIDSILAYIVVSIPLIYILVFMIGTLYHYAVQSYISQIVKETVTNASAYGGLTTTMVTQANNKLTNITGSQINYTLVRKRYNPGTDSYVTEETNFTGAAYGRGENYFQKGDIIALQVESVEQSMLGSISNFSLFGSVGTTDMHYSGYREDIIRNEGENGL